MRRLLRPTAACLILAAISLGASSRPLRRLTPQRIAELTAPSIAPKATGYTVTFSGPAPGASPATVTGPLSSARITLPADKPRGTIEFIREFAFPSAFNPPAASPDGTQLIAPVTPTAFQKVDTGWKIDVSVTPHEKLLAIAGRAEFTTAEIRPGGYGAVAGRIYSDDGKYLSPNVVHQPKFQTTTTHFHIFAVPGEAYDVTLYRGDTAEKHSMTVSAEF